MYRQILIDPRDIDYQRILWRSSPASQIEEYNLLTVTYGTASAPYLALRVLQQLAHDEGDKYPLATTILKQNMYIDDCVFGADSLQTACDKRDQLLALLKSAGFELHKWAFNHPNMDPHFNNSDHLSSSDKIIQTDDSLKVLGLKWTPNNDTFQFKVAIAPLANITKRSVLSTIARLYDPLGWLTPVVLIAKILMQKLWQAHCDWDASLPPCLFKEWHDYHSQLPSLANISIDRWTGQGPTVLKLDLHGFSDASTAAYGAVLYLKTLHYNGSIQITLLRAKSRVAPLKVLSIPRLELCGALLLSQLIVETQKSLVDEIETIYCWTDSTVTLSWISQSPQRWKMFVANRVQEIQTLVPTAKWKYISSCDNPADLASRGVAPSLIKNKILWWEGPPWLKNDASHWPQVTIPSVVTPSIEERNSIDVLVATSTHEWDLSCRYSSWSKLVRITAYIVRFINLLRRTPTPTFHKQSIENGVPSLLPREIASSEIFWLKYLQQQRFPSEIIALNNNHRLKRTSKIIALNPYLDAAGLIRVGGRLRHSLLSGETRNPIVLASHPLVTLLIREIHLNALHAPSHLTLALLREKYWILRARQVVRSVLYKCIPCTRENARTANELMGDLPDFRVRPVPRAFTHCGIDYAGPIFVRSHPGRGQKSHKAYIAIFICMTVKAVHLELVNDCSTAAFLAALQRFCARRGVPQTIYSDNATNFQGAKKDLDKDWRASTVNSTVLNDLATKGVSWKFIPPATPHFGGLWESCVRSVKHHLKRVIGDHTLTIEEMFTVLCKIEACLNSCPLGALSDNLDDYTYLTPGHFLVGTSLLATPETSLLEESENRLSRWQLTSQRRDSFWRKWSTDYMQTLQQRPKWRDIQNHAQVGRLVLLRNPLAPPCKWKLGRIIECHPGDDNLIRIVTIRTAESSFKRSITKLCFLPIDINSVTDKSPE